ncbi:MAG: Formyltetrahydrofolate deformylase [Chlamydiae bacterium]|nr:Formyltetrahydrofolate deformylase [Chlamydiota bacterium]
MEKYILTISCPDRVGIVAAVSGFLAAQDGFIFESHQFGDPSTEIFFMRIEFAPGERTPSMDTFKENFQPVVKQFEMNWELHRTNYRPKVLIMVSQQGHCLNTLLNKKAMGDLQMEIPAIVSNHADLEKMAKWYETPFYHFPVTPSAKPEQESKVLQLIDDLKIDLVVLARYMQILTGSFVNRMQGRIINIHHSFLPSFKGAKPYHQAYSRGVKLIGATSHYVSEHLDEGAIIEQEVTRVDHTYPPEELVAIGQDIESLALAKAVKWHIQQRVFLNGEKTVVFR